MKVSVRLENLDNLQKYFTEMYEKSQGKRDFTKLNARLREIVAQDVTKRFDSSPPTVSGGVVYGGETWHSLTDYTLKTNPHRVQGKIYIDTQNLKNSFSKSSANLQTEINRSGEFTFTNTIPYFQKLQKLRPIIFLHDILMGEIAETYTKWLLEENK